MGLFDIFKSKEEKEREDLINKLRDQIFPGGNDQFLMEVKELRERLNFKYSQDDIIKTYSHAIGVYHVSNRIENEIVNSILHQENSVVTQQDAVSICNYLKEKYSKEEIKKSFFLLAEKFNCSPSQVADFFQKKLETQNFSLAEIEQSINNWHNKRIEEAKALNISPENTPASLMEIWTREFKDKRYNTSQSEPSKTTAKRLLELAKEGIGILKHIEIVANNLGSERDKIHLLTKDGEVEVLLFNSIYILNLYRIKVKIGYENVRDDYMSLLEGEIKKMTSAKGLADYIYFLNSRMEFYSDELSRLNSQGGLPINLFNSFMVNPLQDNAENITPDQADITIFRNQFKEMINAIREAVPSIGRNIITDKKEVMKEVNLTVLKGKMENDLKSLILDTVEDIKEMPDMMHGILIMQTAGNFCQNMKDNYLKIKTEFENKNHEFGLSKDEYCSVVDEVTTKVLDLVMERPSK